MIMGGEFVELAVTDPEILEKFWEKSPTTRRGMQVDTVETFDAMMTAARAYATYMAATVDDSGESIGERGYVGVNVLDPRNAYFKRLMDARLVDHVRGGAGILIVGHRNSRVDTPLRLTSCFVAEYVAEAFRRIGKKAVAYREVDAED